MTLYIIFPTHSDRLIKERERERRKKGERRRERKGIRQFLTYRDLAA